MNNRRRFLFGAAALLAAPAIARASSLMPVSTLNPVLWGDGIHDDTDALQRIIDRGLPRGAVEFPLGEFQISRSLNFTLREDTYVYGMNTRLRLMKPLDGVFRVSQQYAPHAGARFDGFYIDSRLSHLPEHERVPCSWLASATPPLS